MQYFFLENLLLLIHSYFNPVIELHLDEDDIIISAANYDLDLRSVQYDFFLIEERLNTEIFCENEIKLLIKYFNTLW